MDTIVKQLEAMCGKARAASDILATAGTRKKNQTLRKIAQKLDESRQLIFAENAKDLEEGRKNGMSASLLDRLAITGKVVDGLMESALQIADMDDPVGEELSRSVRPNGLVVQKVRVPFGVIGIIYEARPNVTVDSALLCLKSSNAVILRGGREAIRSNQCLASLMRDVLAEQGLDPEAVQLVTDTTRESATAMMRLKGKIDLLIPRGGKGLIQSVVQNAVVPVIETGVGNCHVYVDGAADRDMAAAVVFNAKTSRPSVCNAVETMLVDQAIAPAFLPGICQLLDAGGVILRGCERTRAIVSAVLPATEEDFYTEYNDLIMAVKVVDGVDGAIGHINKYGSQHSEAIITQDAAAAERFMNLVDAAAVYVNASTRFTDGFEFGLGAEIGISTQKLHARGPMGLKELTTYKYKVYGEGQIR